MVVLGRSHGIREREREREREETRKRGTWEVSKEVWSLDSINGPCEQRSLDLGFKRSLTEITFGVWTPLMGPVRPLYFASCVHQHENLQSLFFFFFSQTLKMR